MIYSVFVELNLQGLPSSEDISVVNSQLAEQQKL